jgi:hypothetical protein
VIHKDHFCTYAANPWMWTLLYRCKHFSLDNSPISPGSASGGCAAPPLAGAPWAVCAPGVPAPGAPAWPAGCSAKGECAGQPSGLRTMQSQIRGSNLADLGLKSRRFGAQISQIWGPNLADLGPKSRKFGAPTRSARDGRSGAIPRVVLQTFVSCTEQGSLQQ